MIMGPLRHGRSTARNACSGLRAAGRRLGGQRGAGVPRASACNRSRQNVGNDRFADWLDRGMPMDKAIVRESTPTTVSVGITHPNGERTFLTNSGHIGRARAGFRPRGARRFVEPGAPCCSARLPDDAAGGRLCECLR